MVHRDRHVPQSSKVIKLSRSKDSAACHDKQPTTSFQPFHIRLIKNIEYDNCTHTDITLTAHMQ